MLKLRARIMAGEAIAMGPGKAALLDAIAAHGSISAAARALGMSYRRGWMLVDVMNRAFASPLVETAAGGSHGGGARLTEAGRAALARYRRLEAAIEAAAREEATAIEAMLA
ncbi:MAG TPA: LysR family transcriptional regulator [Sphingomonas sp.]|nr:LysR family transcriptional regulator [Sphingomonas sp.]